MFIMSVCVTSDFNVVRAIFLRVFFLTLNMLHDALALSTLVLDACHIVRLFVKGSVVVR